MSISDMACKFIMYVGVNSNGLFIKNMIDLKICKSRLLSRTNYNNLTYLQMRVTLPIYVEIGQNYH